MAAFIPVNDFIEQLMKGVHNFSAHTFKLVALHTIPAASDATYADVSGKEIPAGGGYVTGGLTLDTVTLTEAAGLAKVTIADETLVATGAIPASGSNPRWFFIYNDSAASKNLVGGWDAGVGGLSFTAGQSFVADFDPTNGVLQGSTT